MNSHILKTSRATKQKIHYTHNLKVQMEASNHPREEEEEEEDDGVRLAEAVEGIIGRICREQSQAPINNYARQLLANIPQDAAVKLLNDISAQRINKSFDGYIVAMVKKYHPDAPLPITPRKSTPTKRPSSSDSPRNENPKQISRLQSLEDVAQVRRSACVGHCSSSNGELRNHKEMTITAISDQLMILSELEYRKLFLVLSYIGRQKLEAVMSVGGATDIVSKKHLKMTDFEVEIWNKYGSKYCKSARNQYVDWDSGKTYLYHCDVDKDGYHFKGPCLNSTRTHLQRALGDDNVLIVKLLEDAKYGMGDIGEEGILVGTRRFRFLVFKDEHKRPKKNQKEGERTSSSLKCYFVRVDSVLPSVGDNNYILSGKSVGEIRRLFMHIHTVLTMEKYMARFSLILSQTIKLQVDFGAIKIETIEDIYLRDENGSFVYDEDKKPLIHTDGTGFISEDLATKCPKDFSLGSVFQKGLENSRNTEPPLLMQCRLFYNGLAVKGTLLVNKKLKGVIQVRPSMIKVARDDSLSVEECFNSLEIVSVSHRPGRTYLSKTLISLLSYGGVAKSFFLNLLTNAMEDNQKAFTDKRAALRVASNHDGLDFGFIARMMISCGIPLNEPFLHNCLWNLKKDEKAKLKKGKIPISESFYLMGTADPTGLLDNDEVCVILDNGQISGKVLVYRNPGLHFGDIHVMKAVYVKELEEYVGNSKYGILFSIKGSRSAAYEMATGDFDGDMYWVSRHPELLENFKASEPWHRVYPTRDANSKNPQELSPLQLERELFRLHFEASKSSFDMPMAAEGWLAFMDRLLILGDDQKSEKDCLKEKMIQLIDIYYDAIDAPKSGKRVKFPNKLKRELYPHHMGKGPEKSYHSESILGNIHDKMEAYKDEAVPKTNIWKLPRFDITIPETYIHDWKERYEDYRKEMCTALNSGGESKKDAANDVIKKYKQLLYDAPEMDESTKPTEVIYLEALAIYHVTYDYAKSLDNCGRCSFAWKVAGTALCNAYAFMTAANKEKPVTILPSVLRDVLNGQVYSRGN